MPEIFRHLALLMKNFILKMMQKFYSESDAKFLS